jgi:hypothetical protein
VITNWGYDINGNSLPGILDAAGFNALTGNKYQGDARIESMLASATAAVRDYCGWHVYPSTACTFTGDTDGVSRIIQLPARHVTAVSSVKINGETLDASEYRWKSNGLIGLVHGTGRSDWNDIEVVYTAGISESWAAALKELIAYRVSHALAGTNGVQSEATGGVSVTYNASWINGASASGLPDTAREVLTPYRLQGVF